jgi:hypothetical protein
VKAKNYKQIHIFKDTNMSQFYRYPGVQPFTSQNQRVFFGREEDTKELCRYLKLENLIVLFGKSGLGKTSLLNASILPLLYQDDQYQPILIRFNNWDGILEKTPVEIFNSILNLQCKHETYIDEIPTVEPTIWQSIKKLQLSEEKYASGKFILVMDQFEEFFTYPQGIQEFAIQLSDVLNQRIPNDFKKNLRRTLISEPELNEKINEHEKERLLSPMYVKVLISIRSDYMSKLNVLKEAIPSILQNCYELKPLTARQARNAIESPAIIDGGFLSPKFKFDDEAINKIIDFLQKAEKPFIRRDEIESFQLQIICRHIEIKVVEKKIAVKGNEIIITNQDIDIDLDQIIEQYYDEQLDKLDEKEQSVARLLIEDGLILDKEERRTNLDIGVLKSRFPEVTDELLRKLVNNHILRAEPNTYGSVSYELSHDTLVDPILRKKRKRQEEFRILQETHQRIKDAEERAKQIKTQQKRIRNRILYSAALVFITILSGSLLNIYSFWKDAVRAERIAQTAVAKYSEVADSKVSILLRDIRIANKVKIRDSLQYILNLKVKDSIINSKEVRIEELKKISEESISGIYNLQKKLEDSTGFLRKQIDQLILEKEQYIKAQKMLEEKKSENQKLNIQVSDAETRFVKVRENYSSLQTDLKKKDSEIATQAETIRKLEKENTRLTSEIEIIKRKLNEAREQGIIKKVNPKQRKIQKRPDPNK